MRDRWKKSKKKESDRRKEREDCNRKCSYRNPKADCHRHVIYRNGDIEQVDASWQGRQFRKIDRLRRKYRKPILYTKA